MLIFLLLSLKTPEFRRWKLHLMIRIEARGIFFLSWLTGPHCPGRFTPLCPGPHPHAAGLRVDSTERVHRWPVAWEALGTCEGGSTTLNAERQVQRCVLHASPSISGLKSLPEGAWPSRVKGLMALTREILHFNNLVRWPWNSVKISHSEL